jgi:hypothetical protein
MSNTRSAAARRQGPRPARPAAAGAGGPTLVERFLNASFPNHALRPQPAAAAEVGPTTAGGGAAFPLQGGVQWQDAMFGGRAVAPTVTPVLRNSGAGNASVALQNAAQGVRAQPSWNWNAPENAQLLSAAQGAGDAALAIRAAQGGRGYLSAGASQAPMTTDDALLQAQGAGALDLLPAGATADDAILAGQAAGVFSTPAGQSSGLPDTSNPASDAYWQRADIREWADKNDKLATQLRSRHGLSPWSSGMGQQAVIPDVAPAGFNPTQVAFSEPAAPIGSDPAQRMAPGQMRSGPETEIDLAQALNSEHLQNIKLGVLRGDENLTAPPYFQGGGSDQQGSWPWGRR